MKAALVKHKRFKDVPKYNPAAERVRQRATWLEQVGLDSPCHGPGKNLLLLSGGLFVEWMPFCWTSCREPCQYPGAPPLGISSCLPLPPSLSLSPFAVCCWLR